MIGLPLEEIAVGDALLEEALEELVVVAGPATGAPIRLLISAVLANSGAT